MGRYEDLLAAAKGGDQSAFEALGTEFSGTALRKQAEDGAAAQKKATEYAGLAREAKLGKVVSDLPEELKGVALSVEDFSDINPEDLTIEKVSEKARSKAAAETASLAKLASAQGFESVEAFQAAMEAAKATQTKKVATMTAIGGGTSSGSGGPIPVSDPEPFEAMKTDYDAARKAGMSQDKAMGKGMEALLGAASPVEGKK